MKYALPMMMVLILATVANAQTPAQVQIRATCFAAEQLGEQARAGALDERATAVTWRTYATDQRKLCTDPVQLEIGDDFMLQAGQEMLGGDGKYGDGLAHRTPAFVDRVSGDANWAATRWNTATDFYAASTPEWLNATVDFGTANIFYDEADASYSAAWFAYFAGSPPPAGGPIN